MRFRFLIDEMLKIFKSNLFVIVVLLVYLIIGTLNIVFHELWRDELHGWALAINSSNIFQLIENKSYDGQMHLWYVIQFIITRFTTNSVYLQVVHLFIASVSIFIILKFSPFTKLQKVLLPFSYFLLFEYSTISRSYALGVLFLFIICALYPYREKRFFIIILLLCILAQINIYVLILSIILFSAFMLEFIQNKRPKTILYRNTFFAIISFCFAIIFSLHQTIPPSDSAFMQWFQNPIIALAGIWEAYIPIPQFSVNFWNTNIISSYQVRAILSLIVLIPLALLFARNKWVLLIFIGGTIGILSFSILKYLGFQRHNGHYFILFIISFWIFQYFKDDRTKIKFAFVQKTVSLINKYQQFIFTFFLLLHLVVGIYACSIDWQYPFSANKKAAEYIRNNKLPEFIVADWDTPCSGISSLLNKDFYYLSCSAFRPFIKFNTNRIEYPRNEIPDRAYKLAIENKKPILLLLNYNLKEFDKEHFEYLAKFEKSIVKDEVFYFYKISP
jgi:hypothetical protein